MAYSLPALEMLGPVVGSRVIGATPDLWCVREADRIYPAIPAATRVRERQAEILAWLAASGQPDRAWVALDDMPELFSPGRAQLVLCDPREGLTSGALTQLDGHARRCGLLPVNLDGSGIHKLLDIGSDHDDAG